MKYSAVDGQAIFEGDIVLGSVAEMETIKKQVENPQPGAEAAVIISGNQFRWPDGVVVFRIDSGSGRLTATGQEVQVGSPVCVKFLAIK